MTNITIIRKDATEEEMCEITKMLLQLAEGD